MVPTWEISAEVVMGLEIFLRCYSDQEEEEIGQKQAR
jgi:hypothetical protein